MLVFTLALRHDMIRAASMWLLEDYCFPPGIFQHESIHFQEIGTFKKRFGRVMRVSVCSHFHFINNQSSKEIKV